MCYNDYIDYAENGGFIKIFWSFALKKDEVWRKIIPKNENPKKPLQSNVSHNFGLGIYTPLQSLYFYTHNQVKVNSY